MNKKNSYRFIIVLLVLPFYLLSSDSSNVIMDKLKLSDKVTDTTSQTKKEITIENEDNVLIIEEDDEELLITDDSEENLLIEQTKEQIKSTASPKNDVSPEKAINSEENQNITTEIEANEANNENQEEGLEKTEIVKEKVEKKAISIEEMKLINFSKNLKEYRSPKKAMFMSLLVPGLGQAYSKKYWKTALFGIIEIGLIGLSVKLKYEGNQEKNRARRFADQHFNPDKFFDFYNNYSTYVKKIATEDTTDTIDLMMVFSDSLSVYKNKYTKEKLADYESNERKDFDSDITRDELVQGWDDCEPMFDANNGYILKNSNYSYTYSHYYNSATGKTEKWLINQYNKGDTIVLNTKGGIYGFSENQNKYLGMIRTSNDYYNASKYMIFILITNHIVSAVDAFITAKAYNDKLLKKQSLWQKINVDHRVALTDNGFQSHFGIKVKF